jgi:Ca-activated chloride channel homolog
VRGSRASRRLRLHAGLLALLPSLGADDAAHQAVREGNTLYEDERYEAALERYGAAAALLPDSAEITFNQGNVWFRRHDYDRAIEHYMAALATEDPRLKSRVKYNIGVIRLRQALGTEQSLTEASGLTRSAIRSFRESLELDRGLDDGRYNLELAYGFLRQIERKLDEREPAAASGDRTSLRRGQALRDQIRNEGPGDRRAFPDRSRQPYGERGGEAPENFSSNQQQERPNDAQLPVAMSPEGAAELMERLLQKMQAAENWLQERRRADLQAPGEREPW